MDEKNGIELRIGAVGGAYFLASPGELIIDVEKCDLNERDRHTELRAILAGPDRRVIQEARIADGGRPVGSGMGPAQRARLSACVDRKGIYVLNVTVSQDRYGEDIVWGFRTNCPHYLIETSRGHRDARHQEPIVLRRPDRASDICFLPRRGAFAMEVAGLPAGVGSLPVYDAADQLIHALAVDAAGRASYRFPGDAHRQAVPWRLHLPAAQATVQIDGVTRWDREDRYPNLSYWTNDPASYFPFPLYRWILTPYSRTVYAAAEHEGEIPFQVHNNSEQRQIFELTIEFPDRVWPVRLSAERIELNPSEAAPLIVYYTAGPDASARTCHPRVTPQAHPEMTTYSTLTVKAGTEPASRPLDMPLVFKPYRHENEQFGYLPDYPVETEMYFDLQNRPFVQTGQGLATLQDGRWATTDLRQAVRSRVPPFDGEGMSPACTKLAFDRDNDLYLVARLGGHSALLHSTDEGRTFTAYAVGGEGEPLGTYDIEQYSGHNLPEGPPPILRSVQTAADDRLIWRRICTLDLYLPEKKDGGLEIGTPIPISENSLGVGSHSGIPSAVVSRDSNIHVIWAEPTDPDKEVPGVPTYVVTYDRQTGTLSEPALIGYGAPPNDVHNRPCITMDREGVLHALAGTHGRPFQYARSLQPNDAGGGWTEAEAVSDRQTYIGLVCGPDGVLHLVFRLWRYGAQPFPVSHHAALAYQRKRPGAPWENPRILVVAPFSEYSIFYHRLTIDRVGRLFLSYDYWSTYWFYRTDRRGRRRSVMMSSDGGESWKLLESRDIN